MGVQRAHKRVAACRPPQAEEEPEQDFQEEGQEKRRTVFQSVVSLSPYMNVGTSTLLHAKMPSGERNQFVPSSTLQHPQLYNCARSFELEHAHTDLMVCIYTRAFVFLHNTNTLVLCKRRHLNSPCLAPIPGAGAAPNIETDKEEILNSFDEEYRAAIRALPAELFPQNTKHGKHSFTVPHSCTWAARLREK